MTVQKDKGFTLSETLMGIRADSLISRRFLIRNFSLDLLIK